MVKVGDYNIPDELMYTEEHEYTRIEDEELVKIGITDYAQKSLRDIVYVELPKKGTEVTQGSEFGSIESVKAVSEIYAPISGVIEEVNSELENSPELINEDPYGEGWLVVIRASNLEGDKPKLLGSKQYAKVVKDASEKK
ncbi:MAG: glycine cleavage system protein GcvH [Candidatus Atabeyarchaeum deiterrae]|jgi:glycine cleavage system H protein